MGIGVDVARKLSAFCQAALARGPWHHNITLVLDTRDLLEVLTFHRMRSVLI